MKTHLLFAIVIAVAGSGQTAHAQSGCWTDITSWGGTYTLSAKGTVSCGNHGTCTINESVTARTQSPAGDGADCIMAGWSNTDSIVSVSVNDTHEESCAPAPGTYIATLTNANPRSAGSSITVTEPNTYGFISGPIANATLKITSCDGTTSTVPVQWPVYPASSWPQTFPLPGPDVQALKDPNDGFQALNAFAGVPVTWTLSFGDGPNYNPDDHCKDDGNSTIGCQTQSLGEDVPVVGTGFNMHYEGNRNPAAGGNSIASADASMLGGWTLSVHHAYDPVTNTLFLGDGAQRNGYQLGSPIIYNKNYLLTSEDGREVYVFNSSTGQHLQTVRPLTGALVYQFTYDAAGKLVKVTDASGNVTTITRNASEQPTSIVSTYGQTTTFALDKNGFLSKVTDPLGKSATFVNTGAGQLTFRTDENGNVFTYTYDANNKLSKDADPVGGYKALTRTNATSGLGWTVGETTAMGRATSYESTFTLPWIHTSTSTYSEQHTNTWPDGLQATSSKTQQGLKISESVALPNGTSNTDTLGPDPVWGMQVPVATTQALTQGNLTMSTSASRSTTLGTSGDPFTVATSTDTQIINGRAYKSTFTGSTRSYVNTSPVGRNVTTVLDSLERIASTQLEGLTATDFTYDNRGRLASLTRGPRTATFAYDTDGRLASLTDPLGHKSSFVYDADGRLLSTTLADGHLIGYSYDANGNLTSVTPPGKSAHSFTYTKVNSLAEYTPPAESGTGPTTYSYNADRQLTQMTRPDGKTISYDYDTAGRLSSVITPTETIDYTYNSSTGNLTRAAIASGESLIYGYNGPLLTSTQRTGTIDGTVSRAYNNNFWVTSQSINGTNTVVFSHDNDGLLTDAGSLVIIHNSQNGLITGTTLGSASDTRSYNAFGELTGYISSYKGAALDTVTYTRDADGRVSGKTETIGGKTTSYAYAYDAAGRLTGVTQNGKPSAAYTYDTNSNRLKATTPSGTAVGTYDAQDRLLTYGAAAYTYTANGELETQTAGSQKTSYQYDVLGNLTAVTLPNGTAISYVVDAENHRVGKKVNGVLVSGFLYDGNKIVAQLNGSNAILSQFVYGTGSSAPDYMISDGVTYRIFSDQLGSPRLVVNTSTGAIAEEISYDEFGNVLSDTKPGFQPFGFAGGLYDYDTKLVRFGARDYNATIGRWTAKDPIRFVGGDTNLYGYAMTDPVNKIDPSGLSGEDCVCRMPPQPKPYKPVPFRDYTPGVEEIQAIVQQILNNMPPGSGPLPGPAADTGTISAWPYDLPNYTDYSRRPNGVWKWVNDVMGVGKRKNVCGRPIVPPASNPGEVGNGQEGDQEGEPIPDAPETVVEPIP